jgi:predicted nucleotidyltransferase
MFTPHERQVLRDELIAEARADDRITAAALVGSAVRGAEDPWSDIDLMLRLADGLAPERVADDWSVRMRAAHGAVAQTDVWAGPALYRVFLIANSLQVDVSFWPAHEFASSGPPIKLVFGAANEPRPVRSRDPHGLIGTAWLYALHVRSSIARGRSLQALYMLNTVRDQVITLASLRHALPAAHARGADDLPDELAAALRASVPGDLTEAELRRAFEVLVGALLAEATHVDAEQARLLAEPLHELVRTACSASGEHPNRPG